MQSCNSDNVSAVAKEIQFFTKAARALFPLPIVVQGDSLPRSAEEKITPAEDECRPIRLL